MQQNRLLTFLVISAFILAPVLLSWWEESGHQWFRPFAIWLFLIVATYWASRKRAPHDI